MLKRPRIGLIGPDDSQPCGIADYTGLLREALGSRAEVAFAAYRDALEAGRFDSCQALLVQYERSLMPGWDFLPRLARQYPGKIYLVPHEVYAEDPFAFPYANLRAGCRPYLWLKRWRYRWRHREYGRENALQRRGYFAQGIIPVSPSGAEILKAWTPERVKTHIPLAFPAPRPGFPGARPASRDYFPVPPRAILGVFGFLNPSHDYASLLDLLAGLEAGICLLMVGSYRDGERVGEKLDKEVAARGLTARVRVTGYIPAPALDAHLGLCDVFISPWRFKSSSASLLHLFPLGKPIFAADLPLTRYLRGEGAPLEIYTGPAELSAKVKAALEGRYRVPANRYPWTFDKVAEAYLQTMLE